MEENNVTEELTTKDVFISHSWGDKEKYVEPLVTELEAVGVSCWYDLLEVLPGDSLVEKINNGLSNSKIILLCLSENFLKGNWSVKELEAAVGMGVIDSKTQCIIPLFLNSKDLIIKTYPLPFASTAYIEWKDNINDLIMNIIKVKSNLDKLGTKNWIEQANKAYSEKNYANTLLYARKALSYDNKCYEALIYLIAALCNMDKLKEVFDIILKYEDEWDYISNDNIPVEVLDFAQDKISNIIIGDEVSETPFTFAIVSFMGTIHNKDNAWKYLIRLFNKEKFEFHQDSLVRAIIFMGREYALDWIENTASKTRNSKVKEGIITMLNSFINTNPEYKNRILRIIKPYLNDSHEDIRELTLVPYYFFAQDGSERIVKALKDRAPMVRGMAFELLSGMYNMSIKETWESVENYDNREKDPLLTEELVVKLLNDPDPDVIEVVLNAIEDEAIELPSGIEINNITIPEDDEVRCSKVSLLGKKLNNVNINDIIDFAINDPSEFVRKEAVYVLKNSDLSIDNKTLETLYYGETIHEVKEEIGELVIDKGGVSFGEIYFQILDSQIDSSFSSYTSEKSFKKILDTKDKELINKAIQLCKDYNKIDIITKNIDSLLGSADIEQTISIANLCLNNNIAIDKALLVAGSIDQIPIERIKKFNNHESYITRVNSYRAEENRLKDRNGLKKIYDLLVSIKPLIKKNNFDAQWGTLSAIDGIFEFGSKDESIKLLKEFYRLATKEKDSSFPIRAAWERLKILGVNIAHKVYSKSEPTIPSPWPDRNGPFYRKIST